MGLGGAVSRRQPVSSPKQTPRALRQPSLRRSKAGKQLIPDWLVSAWGFLVTGRWRAGLLIAGLSPRPGIRGLALGRLQEECPALAAQGSIDSKSLLAFPAEKACFRTSRVNVSFFQRIGPCKQVETSRGYRLRRGLSRVNGFPVQS